LAAGFSVDELRAAGFSDEELIAAGIIPAVAAAEGAGEQTDLQAIMEQQQAQLSAQQREQDLQQLLSAMTNQASQLFAAWQLPEQEYAEGTPPEEALPPGMVPGVPGAPGGPGVVAGQNAPIVKAGSIIFAVLETAINSDEPGPVMARIIQGKLKGATLLGTLTRQNKKVLLTFNLMSIPGMDASLPIQAVAIDPDTARTALASDVDNHYLLRYGTAFAASFMQGFGDAVGKSGSSLKEDANGNVFQENLKFSTQEKALIALGSVGQKFGSVLEPIFNTPPTVTVDSGVGLGILYLQDVIVTGS